MHKALYREYRPRIFDDVIGQEHIIRTLKNQIKDSNLSHAYLFCGTRGTGKTSTAKILSRAVNCIDRDLSNPCNKCSSCKSILEGSNLDVIEIDAASNNGVDDIRELRETVKYTPNGSKYKVYIIDEVHMLSAGAFNALLKTLEEPPGYVLFILATTEPNKIPATILSRCQRFDFKRISIQVLMDNMRMICEKEGVSIDDDALRIIARNGQGSVRDSLSILDKCVSFASSEKLGAKEVLELLGSADSSQLFELARSIIDSEVAKSMKLIDDYFMWGKDLNILVSDTISFFRSLMMMKIFNSTENFMDLTQDYIEQIKILSSEVEMEDVIRILNLLSELMDKLKHSTNKRMTLEIYIMKLSAPASDNSETSILKRIEKIEKIVEDGKINITSSQPVRYVESSNTKEIAKKEETSVAKEEKFDIIDDEEIRVIKNKWGKLLEKMKLDRMMPLSVFLSEPVDLKYKNEILYVVIEDALDFSISRLEKPENKEYIKSVMREIFGLNIEPRFILKKDQDSMNFEKEEKAEDDNKAEEVLKGIAGSIDFEITQE